MGHRTRLGLSEAQGPARGWAPCLPGTGLSTPLATLHIPIGLRRLGPGMKRSPGQVRVDSRQPRGWGVVRVSDVPKLIQLLAAGLTGIWPWCPASSSHGCPPCSEPGDQGRSGDSLFLHLRICTVRGERSYVWSRAEMDQGPPAGLSYSLGQPPQISGLKLLDPSLRSFQLQPEAVR